MTDLPAGIGARALGWIGSLWTSHWILICVIVGLVGYHEYALLSAVHEAKAAKDVEWTAKIAAANQEAKDDHDKQQLTIDGLASSTQPVIVAKMDAIGAQLAKLAVLAKKPPQVFRPDCVLPAQEVSDYNAIK